MDIQSAQKMGEVTAKILSYLKLKEGVTEAVLNKHMSRNLNPQEIEVLITLLLASNLIRKAKDGSIYYGTME
jgi:hypothetical protein